MRFETARLATGPALHYAEQGDPATGHCPNWERPEDVAADLQAFLRETSVSAR